MGKQTGRKASARLHFRWSSAFYIRKQYFLCRQKVRNFRLIAIDVFADSVVYYGVDQHDF